MLSSSTELEHMASIAQRRFGGCVCTLCHQVLNLGVIYLRSMCAEFMLCVYICIVKVLNLICSTSRCVDAFVFIGCHQVLNDCGCILASCVHVDVFVTSVVINYST
jgi:hypothetical protein